MRNVKLERRHFEVIAATLKACKPEGYGDDWNQWRATVSAFIAACYCSNGRFDRDRFVRACGIGMGE